MNTKAINSAAGVINAALTQGRTAAGIALALDSAGMLMTPEIAAELAALRERFAVSDHPADEDPIAYAVVGEVAVTSHGFEAEYQGESDAKRRLPNCKSCGRPAGDPAHDDDVRPQVRKLRALLAVQRTQVGGAS